MTIDRELAPRSEIANFFGGDSDGDTPVPIPNTEVKPVSADGTWAEMPWESRTSPDFSSNERDQWSRSFIFSANYVSRQPTVYLDSRFEPCLLQEILVNDVPRRGMVLSRGIILRQIKRTPIIDRLRIRTPKDQVP